MGISEYPSTVTLPETGRPYPGILEFLVKRFPNIGEASWRERIIEKKVLDEKGHPITLDTAYIPLTRLRYFREVRSEPLIPFKEEILFRNDDLLVSCKPHFLPVIPGGPYVNECLLNRLRKRTGNAFLTPVNRIDRETAGIVLFSVRRETRGLYQELFMTGKVEKTYRAVGEYTCTPEGNEWVVANRIVKGDPWFKMKSAPGKPNSLSKIKLKEVRGRRACFTLTPVTGKKHQLRVHMSGLGFGIENDRYYPLLQPETEDDFEKPLQLIAEKVRFRDPVTGETMAFRSGRRLLW